MSHRTFRIPAVLLSLLTAVTVSFTTRAEDQLVVWSNLVNVAVDSTGTVLRKTGGCDGCDDAGAISQQELTAGDGYVEFTVGEATTFWMAGLGHGNDGTGFGDVDFGFRFNGLGTADVIENGSYAGGDTPYAAGDVFRVAVVNGRVQYSRNGGYLKESARVPQYPLRLDVSLGSVGASVRDAKLGFFPPPPPGGGFLEKAGSPAKRARFTRAQIDGFIPAGGARGKFRFPSPYNTDAVRLTTAADCSGGDCLWYTGYSYWRNINNHVASAEMYIFLGSNPNRGGSGPFLLRYNKVTDNVQNVGPLFTPGNPYYNATGEGWYFSGTKPTKLYTFLVGFTQLRRFDILTRTFDAEPALDLALCPRPNVCPTGAAFITQPHSSDDDQTHSATVQNQTWQRIGCVVAQGRRYYYYAPASGYLLDECHVDKSGRWLMLLETTAGGSRINRVVNLRNGRITTIQDVAGALGHLDMGHGYAVGADTYNPLPNATILLKFPVQSTTRPLGPVVHYNKRWDIAAANHVAHGNAAAGAPEDQYACGSNASRVADMADEIVCFSLDSNRNADGSLDVLVVGQVLTDLNMPGGADGTGSDYSKLPKGNLDVTGRYFIWTTNLGGDRLDAVLVKIPAERVSP